LDQNSIIKSYKRVSSFYDFTFGQVFKPGQKTVIQKMNCDASDSVLEIGIGTGASLQFYPKDTKVIGVDISPDMLNLARKKLVRNGCKNKHISLMNGEQLSFADNTFDKVVVMYVVSVTQNPKTLIQEMKRVCKDDGDIYIVNHFSSESDGFIIKMFEKALMPVSKILGWKPYFLFSEFNSYANLDVKEISKVNLFDYWNIIHANNNK
jgi:phosphatidylethanolamine/phosphatidyl-N-methylethanolamine N-methyltransferase